MLNVDRKIIVSQKSFFFLLSLEFQKMTSASFDFMLVIYLEICSLKVLLVFFFSVSLSKYLQCSF